VQTTSVATVARALQRDGLIGDRHGILTIRDDTGLENAAANATVRTQMPLHGHCHDGGRAWESPTTEAGDVGPVVRFASCVRLGPWFHTAVNKRRIEMSRVVVSSILLSLLHTPLLLSGSRGPRTRSESRAAGA